MKNDFIISIEIISEGSKFDPSLDIVDLDLNESNFFSTIEIFAMGEKYRFFNQPVIYFLRNIYRSLFNLLILKIEHGFLMYSEDSSVVFCKLEKDIIGVKFKIGKKEIFCQTNMNDICKQLNMCLKATVDCVGPHRYDELQSVLHIGILPKDREIF